MDEATRKKVRTRLRRVAGQVAGIVKMVEEDRYCVDVLRQINAAQAALGKSGEIILRSHVETCVTQAIESGKPKQRAQKIDELMEVIAGHGNL